jgi:hypothetical protein
MRGSAQLDQLLQIALTLQDRFDDAQPRQCSMFIPNSAFRSRQLLHSQYPTNNLFACSQYSQSAQDRILRLRRNGQAIVACDVIIEALFPELIKPAAGVDTAQG